MTRVSDVEPDVRAFLHAARMGGLRVRITLSDGCRLYVDVEGLGLVNAANGLEERPTLVLLHGGPGFDHVSFKPAFSALTDVCQVVYLDHRGQGRSDRRTPDEWTLDQWADDVAETCDLLGIERPVVLGNSFGGFVAMRYAIRHPGHAAGIVLSSTMARIDAPGMVEAFGALGGDAAREAAAGFWLATDEPSLTAARAAYQEHCGPLYTTSPGNLFDSRSIVNSAVSTHFFLGEGRTMDHREALTAVVAPTLCLAGEFDPVCTPVAMAETAASIPGARLEMFARCGHGVYRDDPDRAFAVLRDFIASVA